MPAACSCLVQLSDGLQSCCLTKPAAATLGAATKLSQAIALNCSSTALPTAGARVLQRNCPTRLPSAALPLRCQLLGRARAALPLANAQSAINCFGLVLNFFTEQKHKGLASATGEGDSKR